MVKYKKGQVWKIAKTQVMKDFEKETGKNAIYNGKITGGFEYWLWQKEKKKSVKSKAKPKSLKKQIKKFGLYQCDKCKAKFVYELGPERGCENCHSYSNTLIDQSNVMKKEWFKSKPKPKSKSKPKPKRQVIDKKQKRIDEIQREVNWINENIKSKEDSIDKKVEERRKYYNDLLEKEHNTKVRRQIYNKLSKIRREYQNEIWKLQQKRDKEQAKVIAVNLNFNKINRLVRDNFKKSKYSASHQVRGYGESSTGYEIVRPTLHDPYITIKWFVYWSVSTENREKSTKKFKDKLKLILRENNIKFTEDHNKIFIGK